jgi:Ca-activated chloride channel homolog
MALLRFHMLSRLSVSFLLLLGLLSPNAALQDPAPPQKPVEKTGGQKGEQKGEDVISIDTTVVVLNVTVTDAAEKYVRGLKAQDFRIFEDQTPQKISSFSVNEMPFAAVILLDTSGSMQAKMSIARSACSRFVDGIRLGDVFAIFSFGGTKVKMLQDFTEVRDVGFAIWDADADGETPLYDAIVTASEKLAERPERRRVVLLLSDGADTKSKVSQEEALRRSLAADVSVYAVDLSDAALYRLPTHDPSAEIMRTFSQKSGGRFFKNPGGSALNDAFAQTIDELRNQYTITYETTNDKRDGKWRATEARVMRPGLNVRTRQGYFAARPKK